MKEFRFYPVPFDINKPAPSKPIGGHIDKFREYEFRLNEHFANIEAAKNLRQAMIVFTYPPNGSVLIDYKTQNVTDGELISACEIFKAGIIKKITSPQELAKAECDEGRAIVGRFQCLRCGMDGEIIIAKQNLTKLELSSNTENIQFEFRCVHSKNRFHDLMVSAKNLKEACETYNKSND